MKVADLTGPDLDKWVAHAHGMMPYTPDWQPSRNWAQGGPLIERESIGIIRLADGEWTAGLTGDAPWEDNSWNGATPLEAAMRCYVASKFGDEVDDADQA